MKNKGIRFFVGVSLVVGLCILSWRLLIQQASIEITGTRIGEPKALSDIAFQSAYPDLQKLSDLKGKWTIIFLGFLNCPDICPTTVAYLSKEYAELLENRKYAQMVFISVDPDRDTPDKIKDYVSHFSPEVKGVTASTADLNRLAGELATFFQKQTESSSGEYSVAHAGDLFLINPKGEWVAFYRPPLLKDVVAEDLRRLILKGRM